MMEKNSLFKYFKLISHLKKKKYAQMINEIHILLLIQNLTSNFVLITLLKNYLKN